MSAMAAAIVIIGSAALLQSAPTTVIVSAWSTSSRHAMLHASNRHGRRQHSRIGQALLGDGDDDDVVSGAGRDGSNDDRPRDEPRPGRKRAALRRTLGGGGPAHAGPPPVRLDTAGLFRGVPGLDALLGPSPVPAPVPNPEAGAASSDAGRDGREDDLNSGLLTPADEAALDNEYDTLRAATERRVADALAGDGAGDGDGSSSDSGGASDNARRIVGYTVAEEKRAARRRLEEQRKGELLAQWEEERRRRVGGDEGGTRPDEDAVVNEILRNAAARDAAAETAARATRDLESYTAQALRGDEAENTYQEAVSQMAGGEDGASRGGADLDAVYRAVLSRLRSSRSERLGPATLGVLANSVALEEGRAYVERREREREFLADLEGAAGALGVHGDEEMAAFFRAPEEIEEEQIYRSIVRRIVNQRPPATPVVSGDTQEAGGRAEEEMEDGDSDDDNDDDDDDDDDDDGAFVPTPDVKAKFTLDPGETAEAYKLLNLWRELRAGQDALELASGLRAAPRARPTNKMEPLFLYELDSEEKRQQDQEQLAAALRATLASDDAVENSSSELLMKELLEGGATRDRTIRLLDKLEARAKDTAIRESLQGMKRMILEEDEGEKKEDSGDSTAAGPLDLTEMFSTLAGSGEGEMPPPRPRDSGAAAARTVPSWVRQERDLAPVPPASSGDGRVVGDAVADADADAGAEVPPPPDTPFFRATSAAGEGNQGASEGESVLAAGEDTSSGNVLGTYEEQKLQMLAGRVGARTEAEVEELRRNVEALKEVAAMATAELNDDNFDVETASAQFGVDVDALDLEDEGDGQIMSIIGKRPTATSSSVATASTETTTTSSSTSSLLSNPQQNMVSEFTEGEIIVDATGHLKQMDGGEETHDIAGDLFRARTAGRYQDRETRDADEAAYRDFLQTEDEAVRRFDAAETTAAATLPPDIDFDAYADDILSDMGPRARVVRPEDTMSWEDLQKERKKENIFGDDNDDPFPVRGDARGSDDAMPEWFRKEQEARGVESEDLSNQNDDEAQAELDREIEERQRKADEYFKKRGDGISISDVLGREYFGPMDEPDDYEKNSLSSFDSFKARKELLLGYTELTVQDINNLFDYKVDPLATGYNQYLRNVQSPFSTYGAIFRLEGVLINLIGLHGRAWKKVAETHGYKILSGDELRQASLYSPEDAVREVFRWTEDVLILKEIAHTHHAAFREAFNEWEEGNCCVSASPEVSQASDRLSEPPETGPSDEEMLSMYYLSWSKLAKNLDRSVPSKDEVSRGVAAGDWEFAVQEIFPPDWKSDNPNEVYDSVVAYDEILQADYRVLLLKYGINVDAMDAKEEETLYGLQEPDVDLQDGVKTWLDTLREVEMPCAVVTHLDSSQLDVVLNATGLAEYFPHDKRVCSDSTYSNQRSELLGAALRLEQRPDTCVVFDNTPRSANEAHDIYMKSISFVDHYARYELLTADLSVGYAGDLNLILFAKLFDKRTDLEPAPELDVNSGLERQQRKMKTAYWDD